MVMSKACVNAVRAMVYLAAAPDNERRGHVSIRAVAEELGLSFHFLTKTLQRLTADGLLKSERGPRGGVALARPAGEISLLEIVGSIDGNDLQDQCILGLRGCGQEAPCPMHDEWVRERKRIQEIFKRSTLQRLARAVREGSVRLKDS
ncbi:MAG: hypothetical protein DHS20C21_18520 [Gemmatimonadota bacterium]|nr:MAG: hypothetical protein DHS20C21_18520 [Gemmatimonadota bacterium]